MQVDIAELPERVGAVAEPGTIVVNFAEVIFLGAFHLQCRQSFLLQHISNIGGINCSFLLINKPQFREKERFRFPRQTYFSMVLCFCDCNLIVSGTTITASNYCVLLTLTSSSWFESLFNFILLNKS